MNKLALVFITVITLLLSACDTMTGGEPIFKEKIVIKTDTVYIEKCDLGTLWEGRYVLESVAKGVAPDTIEINKYSELNYMLIDVDNFSVELEYENATLLFGSTECSISSVETAHVMKHGEGLFRVDVPTHMNSCEGFIADYKKIR